MLGYSFYHTMINKKEHFEKYKDFIPQLPKFEQDIIDYYFNNNMKQKDIALLTGKTQGAISSRLKRAQARLIFLSELKKIDFETILQDLKNVVDDEFDIEVIRCLIATTCQSESAWQLNNVYQLQGSKKMNQVKVRHRFERCLSRLKSSQEQKYLDYYQKLLLIKKNLYLLHELKLPHFER